MAPPTTPIDNERAETRTGRHPQNQRCAMCSHRPPCPSADSADRGAAHTVSAHPEQGWSLLCNGVIVFDDLGALLPDGREVAPVASLPGRYTPRTPIAA
jgi:hypothetical protein